MSIKLKPEQIQRLRKPFDKQGAFKNCTDEQVERILSGAMEIYLTLARINLRRKRK